MRRVYDHLLIENSLEAIKEAKSALHSFPESQKVYCSLMDALSARGEEVDAWQCFQKMGLRFPELKTNRHLLETMAWGVLSKAGEAASLSIQMNALIGVTLTRDVRAIPFLLKSLKNSNASLRSIGVRLCASYPDHPLKEELIRMLSEEKVWYVRLDVINVVGQLKITSCAPLLSDILCDPKASAEEKAAAMTALVHIYETLSIKDLKTLTQSNRAALRELSTALIMHLDDKAHAELLIPLLKDTSPDVRACALSALGFLRISEVLGKPLAVWVTPLLQDLHPCVAITAAWNLLLLGDLKGEEVLQKWLHQEHEEIRRLASSALAASGPYGTALSWKELKKTDDPYVKVNLSLGLIGQRSHLQECSQILGDVLSSKKETLWMWDQMSHPLFRSLSPSLVTHVEHIPDYPTLVDQMTQMELISTLSIVKFPKAQALMRDFLKQKAAIITGQAALVLLQEGTEEDLSLVSSLLQDPDEKVRIQAALILGIFGGDPKVVAVLQEAYPLASRELKVHILEALSHIGSLESVPFLLETFKEPFQLLRVAGASALIQCLYH